MSKAGCSEKKYIALQSEASLRLIVRDPMSEVEQNEAVTRLMDMVSLDFKTLMDVASRIEWCRRIALRRIHDEHLKKEKSRKKQKAIYRNVHKVLIDLSIGELTKIALECSRFRLGIIRILIKRKLKLLRSRIRTA